MFESYDDILTIEEGAELLRIGMTQAYRIVRSGSLKGYKEDIVTRATSRISCASTSGKSKDTETQCRVR